MSHITELGVKFRVGEEDALAVACQECGLTLYPDQKRFRYYAGKMQPCDMVIARAALGESYEIGLTAQPDGTYKFEWDTFIGAEGLVDAVGGREAEKLLLEYGMAISVAEMIAGGYHVERDFNAETQMHELVCTN